MGLHKGSFSLLMVLGVCMNAGYTNAWGTYVCDIQEQGLQKIEEICTESASKFNNPLSSLESKLERVLDFVAEIKMAEDSWFQKTKKTGMVVRDLSQHEENMPTEERKREEAEEKDEREKHNEEEQSRRDETKARNIEEEQTRMEDRENGDDRHNRRNRNDDNDRQNRRDRTNEDRSARNPENERENRMESTNDDEDLRQDNDNDRRKNRDKDDKKNGPEKGNCEVQVIDSHETIGMFYMMSYQHGHCANRNPIKEPIRYCLGYCATRTFIDRESVLWNQGNDCKSCQANKMETLRIPLSCDDGYSFEKKFNNVVDCSCKRCKVAEVKG